MIQWFLCHFFGHKTVVKAFTGETLIADEAFDRNVRHALYKYERLNYCVRCGTKVHKD